MIAFLLGLIKSIGILLLAILIFLLCVVGIVLFVPIRYRGSGQITEEKKEAAVRVTWLLKAVQCSLDYTFPEKPIISIKILGIDIRKLSEKKNSKKAQKTMRAKDKAKAASEKKKKTSKKTVPGVNTSLLAESAPTQTEPSVSSTQALKDKDSKPEEAKSNPSQTSASKKEPEQQKQKEPEEKKIKEKIQTIIDKIKDIIYNVKYYIAILQEDDTKQLIANAREALFKVLKSICPKEFSVKGRFGFAAPDTTGKVYGIYAMVMPLLKGRVILEPDFEQTIIKGEAALKGRITIFVIVVNALRILFDKRLQPLIKKLKHGGNKNGR